MTEAAAAVVGIATRKSSRAKNRKVCRSDLISRHMNEIKRENLEKACERNQKVLTRMVSPHGGGARHAGGGGYQHSGTMSHMGCDWLRRYDEGDPPRFLFIPFELVAGPPRSLHEDVRGPPHSSCVHRPTTHDMPLATEACFLLLGHTMTDWGCNYAGHFFRHAGTYKRLMLSGIPSYLPVSNAVVACAKPGDVIRVDPKILRRCSKSGRFDIDHNSHTSLQVKTKNNNKVLNSHSLSRAST